MSFEALADDLHQAGVQKSRQCEVLIKTPLPAKRSRWNRLWAEFRQAEFFEGHVGQIEGLGPAVVQLPVHAILKIAAGVRLDATLGLQQEHRAGPKNHGARWTHTGASGLEAFLQSVTAKFALRYTWIETCPLKARNMKRAGDRAVAAADAFVGGPADYAGLRIFVQGLERTSCCARRIQAMHTLALHEREGRPVVRLVELNDVAGDIV